MTTTLKVLGQSKPSATTLTDTYTVPGATTAVLSGIIVTNQHSSLSTTIRISIAVAGAADTAKQYIAYDIAIAAGDTLEVGKGITLGAADVVRVYNAAAQCSFNVFGQENS